MGRALLPLVAVAFLAPTIVVPAPSHASSHGEVYVYRDEDGNYVYTDSAEFGAVPINLRDPPNINPNLDYAEQERKYDAIIVRHALKHRVDPFLVKAMIRTESMFDPDAISDAGAHGLMQLMPGTAERFGVKDMLDPEQNIAGGVAYLRWLLDLFKGDTTLAVASYNCGERLVQRERRVPNIPETQGYVVKVEAARRHYRLAGFSASAARLR